MEKVEYILMQVDIGTLGTPKAPQRISRQTNIFWNAYFGMENYLTPKKGEMHYEYVVAGKRHRARMDAKRRA